MTITEIKELDNPVKDKMKPIKEKQDIYIPDIVNKNISRRNGMIYCLTGSGGSGKTNLLLQSFKSKNMYRNKFHNIYYSISVLPHHFHQLRSILLRNTTKCTTS